MDEILKQICKSAYIYVHIEYKQVNHHPQSLLFWFVYKSRNDNMDKTIITKREKDDSLSELSLLYPVRLEEANRFIESEPSVKKMPRFSWEMKITSKARTVRNRKPNTRVWSLGSTLLSLPSLPPAKKQKKRVEAQVQPVGVQIQRQCSHCQVQNTPQWRISDDNRACSTV
ncbi:hypothetical protein JHK82_022115 [Glycine max]|nr:hypothetical protein JHK82_022115 [Glycine max]